MVHPNEKSEQFQKYLSVSGQSFIINPDSCMCRPCYQDALENCSTMNTPRWMKLDPADNRHCPICHMESEATNTPCRTEIHRWAPCDWMLDLNVKQWQLYFTESYGKPFYAQIKETSKICYKHWYRMKKHVATRECILCKCVDEKSGKWNFAVSMWDDVRGYCESVGVTIGKLDWLCMACSDELHTFTSVPQKKYMSLGLESRSAQVRANALMTQFALNEIETFGAVLEDDLLKQFRMDYDSFNVFSFKRYFDQHIKGCNDISVYAMESDDLPNRYLFYDKNVFDHNAAKKVFRIMTDRPKVYAKYQDDNDSQHLAERLKFMIKEQSKLIFSESGYFDCSEIFTQDPPDSECLLLENYLHKPLFDLLKKATGVDNKSLSQLHSHKNNLKIQMAISILCNVHNQKANMLQTINSFVAYASGLRDRAFDMFNMLGVTCSVRHMRNYAHFWSEKREILDEINPNSFWRISFDNLNFHRKFAKTFVCGGTTSGRMLNLITGQVSHRVKSIGNSDTCTSTEMIRNVTLSDFFPDPASKESVSLKEFDDVITKCSVLRKDNPPKFYERNLMSEICHSMPCFTPDEKDTVAYAHVENAQASNIDDVCKYLTALKEELNIGTPGYPTRCVICGDQQTYALVQNLVIKFPSSFNWILPMPGDWHMLKLAGETIKDMLWEGGFQDMANSCGHKKDITQWKDLHVMISAIHQAINHTIAPKLPNDGSTINAFLEKMSQDYDKDEILNFWARTYRYVNAYMGYYFAIRSGNFDLRNACLPILGELFFSYSRHKYEALICKHIQDLHSFPPAVLDVFRNGEWTVSLKGNKFNNLAIDEAHECLINRKLKERTTRPSEFRTVQLSNFMAYLDNVLEKFEDHFFKHSSSQERERHGGNVQCQIIWEMFGKNKVFEHISERELVNIFSPKKHSLSGEQRRDLLSVREVGYKRMELYVKTEILKEANQPKKHKFTKLKTFAKPKSTNRGHVSKYSRLSKITQSLALKIQRSNLFYDRVLEFPLALCDETGHMRDRHKSKIKNAFLSDDYLSDSFCFSIPFPIDQNTEVIIDMLMMIHKTPPPHLATFGQYIDHLWESTVIRGGVSRGAGIVTLVFDKQEFIPPVRSLLRDERKQKTGIVEFDFSHEITKMTSLLHGQRYVKALQNDAYKASFIKLISSCFLEKSLVSQWKNTTVIIDSDEFGSFPRIVTDGHINNMFERHNNKGEADVGIWFHASKSQLQKIIVMASDTDIYMYGMALMEMKRFSNDGDKEVAVELSFGKEFFYVWCQQSSTSHTKSPIT